MGEPVPAQSHFPERPLPTPILEPEARAALARLCQALLTWSHARSLPGADPATREEERRALEGLRAAGSPALEGRAPGHPCREVLEAFAALPASGRHTRENVERAMLRAERGAMQAVGPLEGVGALRDAASFTFLAEVLRGLGRGDRYVPRLQRLSRRLEAAPGQLAPSLGERPCLAPGAHVALGWDSVRCLGDTSFYIRLLDPPSGEEVFSLLDVPIEGVAFSGDGLRVFAQSWSVLSGRRLCEAWEVLTGARLRDVPWPAGPEDVVMLEDIFAAALREDAPRTPLQIRLENTPPADRPAFLFGR